MIPSEDAPVNGPEGSGFWNERKARWYLRGQRLSGFARTVMDAVTPKLAGCTTALDIGAGIGGLTIPLARRLMHVTAMEPSPAMMSILKDEAAREGIGNIRCIEAGWGDARMEPHDLIISANVTVLYDEAFLRQVNELARQKVVLVLSAGPGQDKFFYRELYPLLLNREFPPRADYLKIYTMLHQMGICADVTIVEYDFDQPFLSLDEAVDFWKEYLPIRDDRHDEALRVFLEKKLKPWEDGLIARFHKKSAVVSWGTRRMFHDEQRVKQ